MAAGMVGADVAELESLARAFDASASQLTALAGRVRHGIQISAWVGRAAQRFRVDWNSQHSRVLLTTAQELREAAKHIRQQAEQQRRASAASSGVGLGGLGAGGGRMDPGFVTPKGFLDPYDVYKGAFPWFFGGLSALGAGTLLGRNASLVGRYAKDDWLAGLRYKKGLNGLFKVNGPWHQLSKVGWLDKGLRRLGLLDFANEVEKFVRNPSVGGGFNVIESGLKTSKHPVLYLGGMALSSVHLAVDAAAKTDFSAEGIRTVQQAIERDGWVETVIGGAEGSLDPFLKNEIWKVF